MNKSETSIHYLQTPFIYSGVLYQTRVHIENMLLNMHKDTIRDLWNEVIGKPIFFAPIIEELLSPQERSIKQTLTLLWNDAKIQQLEYEIQLVVSEILE